MIKEINQHLEHIYSILSQSLVEKNTFTLPENNSEYDGHAMTAFYFKDEYGIPKCHCTHKYLGELGQDFDANKLGEVADVIDEYWSRVNKEPRVWHFNKYELFGPEKDVPVLRCMDISDKLLDLKKLLDQFRDEDYPEYKPHVTLKLDKDHINPRLLRPLKMQPIFYGLVFGDEILKRWPMI